jgi:general secretion pathway protein G
MMKRFAFTMIELVFVIVVIGILSAIAIPRLAATRDDAQIAKGRSDVAAIRAGIVSERQNRLLKGETNYIANLEDNGEDLFSNIMQYGIVDQDANGHWHKNNGKYEFKIMNTPVSFDYNSSNGTFTCKREAAGNAGKYCKNLID